MRPVSKKKKELKKKETTSTKLLSSEVSAGFFTWFNQILSILFTKEQLWLREIQMDLELIFFFFSGTWIHVPSLFFWIIS